MSREWLVVFSEKPGHSQMRLSLWRRLDLFPVLWQGPINMKYFIAGANKFLRRLPPNSHRQ
jgi:hypothetical protein